MVKRVGCRGSERASDWLQIPLCFDHHSAQGLDGIHKGVETWERSYGAQSDMIDWLCNRFKLDLWALAAADRPSKILPHRGVSML